MLQSAADYAQRQGLSRQAQERYALQSHHRATAAQSLLTAEITALAGLGHDAYPRNLTVSRAARMPIVAQSGLDDMHGLSALTISAKADGAALLLLATPEACARWQLATCPMAGQRFRRAAPETPMLASITATHKLLQRGAQALQQSDLSVDELSAIELHDAFAVQGLAFCAALGLLPEQINAQGGGLARGHPIGASGAIALVRCLAQLQSASQPGALGMAAIAGAGGVGAGTLVQWRA